MSKKLTTVEVYMRFSAVIQNMQAGLVSPKAARAKLIRLQNSAEKLGIVMTIPAIEELEKVVPPPTVTVLPPNAEESYEASTEDADAYEESYESSSCW